MTASIHRRAWIITPEGDVSEGRSCGRPGRAAGNPAAQVDRDGQLATRSGLLDEGDADEPVITETA